MNSSFSRKRLTSICLMSALASAMVLAVIAPHLIAIISYFFVLGGAVVSFNQLTISGFTLRYLILCSVFFCLALLLSVYSHADYSAMQNVMKLLYLSLPFFFVYSQARQADVYKSCFTRYLPALFYLSLLACLLQTSYGFAIKNIMAEADIYAHVSQLNDLAIASTVIIWLVSAITICQRTFGKYTTGIVLCSFLILTACVVLGHSVAAILGVATSVCCYFIANFYKRKSIYIIQALVISMALFFVTAPQYLYQLNPSTPTILFINKYLGISALQRIDIWEQSLDKIQERPVTGWGNSDSKYLDLDPEPYLYDKQQMRPVFSYPHNIFLQISVEMGVLGLFVLLLLLNLIITTMYRLHKTVRPYAVACFVSLLSVWMVSYPLWRSWWLVFICLLAGSFFLLSEYQRKNESL